MVCQDAIFLKDAFILLFRIVSRFLHIIVKHACNKRLKYDQLLKTVPPLLLTLTVIVPLQIFLRACWSIEFLNKTVLFNVKWIMLTDEFATNKSEYCCFLGI